MLLVGLNMENSETPSIHQDYQSTNFNSRIKQIIIHYTVAGVQITIFINNFYHNGGII
jgi:hypothetical protein